MNDNDGWITLETYCEKYGERTNTVQKRVHDGIWERGTVYARVTGHETYIHEERARTWLQEKGKLQTDAKHAGEEACIQTTTPP